MWEASRLPQVTEVLPTGWLLSALAAPAPGSLCLQQSPCEAPPDCYSHTPIPHLMSLGTKDTEWAAESDGLEVTLANTPRQQLLSCAYGEGACKLITNLSRGLKQILACKACGRHSIW